MHPKGALASSHGTFSAAQIPEKSGVFRSANFGAAASKFGAPAGVVGTPLVWTLHCAGSVTPTHRTMPAAKVRSLGSVCIHVLLCPGSDRDFHSAVPDCAHLYTRVCGPRQVSLDASLPVWR